MKVSAFLIAEDSFKDTDGKRHLVNPGVEEISLMSPFETMMNFFARLELEPNETGRFALCVRGLDADGHRKETVVERDFRTQERLLNIFMSGRIVFRKPGTYQFILYIDGVRKADASLDVKDMTPCDPPES